MEERNNNERERDVIMCVTVLSFFSKPYATHAANGVWHIFVFFSRSHTQQQQPQQHTKAIQRRKENKTMECKSSRATRVAQMSAPAHTHVWTARSYVYKGWSNDLIGMSISGSWNC